MNKNLTPAIFHWIFYALNASYVILMRGNAHVPAWYLIGYGVWTSGVGSVYLGRYLIEWRKANENVATEV